MLIKKYTESVKAVLVAFFRVIYHSLPFSIAHKATLKHHLYSKFPFPFRHTISYRYWELNKQADTERLNSNYLFNKTIDQGVEHSPFIDYSLEINPEQVDKGHNEWFNIICKSIDNRFIKCNGHVLPGFPDSQTQINSVGAAGKPNLFEAYIFFQDVIKHFSNSPNWKRKEKVILDFGCGWGRIARFFLIYFKPENIIGIDIDEELLNICKNTFSGSKFYQCQAFPPTTLESNSIDYIVGYSVFSHLNEIACHQWMKEFKRILKTGGIVALTTRGRPFFDYCISLKGTKQTGYIEALSRIFDDFDKAKRQYDAGEFLHSNIKGVAGGGVRECDFYGESFIPESYARDVLSKYLTYLAFSFDSQKSMHPTIYFQKK